MSIVSLAGDFSVNGEAKTGMDVDTAYPIRFNEASGVVVVVAVNPEGKTVKGVAIATEPTLAAINELGNCATRNVNMLMPSI